MANLKAIRKRIGSVKSTQKITRAMKMVAGARLNRAQQRILAMRAYAVKTAEQLKKMRFEVRPPQLHSSTGAYFVDSHRGASYLRQAFLVSGTIGYSLTLEAPSNRVRSQQLRAMAGAVWNEINVNGLMPLIQPVAPFDRPGFLTPAIAIGGLLGLLIASGVALAAAGGLLLSLLAVYLLLVDVFGFSVELRPFGAR